MLRRLIGLLSLCSLSCIHAIQIAPTDPLPPEEQRVKFKLPEGFEIQLVVSEPDIGQPMNLNFDAQGRLWVTHTVEYPFPAQGEGVEKNRGRFAGKGSEKARDRLSVMEIGQDGKAVNLKHFVTGLNIPIGQTPILDGNTALVYGIPNIFRYTDGNQDGMADVDEVAYSGFGNRDTHGMASSFTRWVDGWIYGCHGFSNQSKIKDQAGRIVTLTSGNTYRFREDGSHFQQITWGQVNPFGMTFDPRGNLYSADCHSKPIYQLLRGAEYPQFGKKPGSLGFGPTMIDHNHGSTGVCGPAYYAAQNFPADYRDNIFICNPVSEKVHRDKLIQHGSTLLTDVQPDFITCADTWFRPVDAMVGPDGALYIADFYNAIIGHYEQPLNHPKRDRTHGRIWRVIHRGPGGVSLPADPMPDLTKLSTADLVGMLADGNLWVRVLATNYLVDGHPEKAVAAVKAALKLRQPFQRAHGLWVLERLQALDDQLVEEFISDPDPLVRIHLVRAMGERETWSAQHGTWMRNALVDEDAFVRRNAADGMSRHLIAENVKPLAKAWQEADPKDTHLIHTIRMALREHMGNDDVVQNLLDQTFTPEEKKPLLEIAALVKKPAASLFLVRQADPNKMDFEQLKKAAPMMAASGQAESFIQKIAERYKNDPASQFELLQGLPTKTPGLKSWFEKTAPELLANLEKNTPLWTHEPLPEFPRSKSPWGLKERKSADGKTTLVIDSIVNGESLTGLYRSQAFTIPKQLSFWLCGHNGSPGQNPKPVNHIRLKRMDNDLIIAKQIPPRSDIAKKYTWNLEKHAGKQGRIEIIDADVHAAYAWIGAGRFDPPVVRVPSDGPSQGAPAIIKRIGDFRITALYPRVQALMMDQNQPLQIRSAAMDVFQGLDEKNKIHPSIGSILKDPAESPAIRHHAVQWLGRHDHDSSRTILTEVLALAPSGLEREIALALCSSKKGAGAFLSAVESGKASGRLFQDKTLMQRYRALASANELKRSAEVVKALPPFDKRIGQLIEQRLTSFDPEAVSVENGLTVFEKNCAACHRIGSKGGLIGPQLDGIGQRGIDRIMEDVLDPNRNVDAAFQLVTVKLKGDQVVSGLPRRSENGILVLADFAGKEIEVKESEIVNKESTNISLMLPNFGEALSEKELHDLMGYLLGK